MPWTLEEEWNDLPPATCGPTVTHKHIQVKRWLWQIIELRSLFQRQSALNTIKCGNRKGQRQHHATCIIIYHHFKLTKHSNNLPNQTRYWRVAPHMPTLRQSVIQSHSPEKRKILWARDAGWFPGWILSAIKKRWNIKRCRLQHWDQSSNIWSWSYTNLYHIISYYSRVYYIISNHMNMKLYSIKN